MDKHRSTPVTQGSCREETVLKPGSEGIDSEQGLTRYREWETRGDP